MYFREATARDLIDIQCANIKCLPENYHLKFFFYHYLSWPSLIQVQVDFAGKITGYVLAKMDDFEEDQMKRIDRHERGKGLDRNESSAMPIHNGRESLGHIVSLAVYPGYRKLGVAAELMLLVERNMRALYKTGYISLQVRRSNTAALALYTKKLGFWILGVDSGYYGNGEDALEMIKRLPGGK
ncbi:hypothetical protein XU18_3954 [Perkinsela sp. CCAP 1560/4]|nr:hypothetical protein XU18_3954 [Perkinsela sp. CCAP 1560/4]|eukprot:KNH04896.1 hypothetical protein XU18_3954 [Perkinsela sp. CCAP 1560/4]